MNYNKKVAFHTLGCKLNFSETSNLANMAIDGGYHRVDFAELADYYVINTCSVTENADKECAYIIRQIKRKAPESKVVIIGCYAQLKPENIAQIPGVDLVLGAAEKYQLVMHLDQMEHYQHRVIASDIREVNEFVPTYSSGDRTRTFLKIQDGCDYFCTFCTIPLARGRSRSQSISKTLEVYREATKSGVREIVLTGVNTGDFGKSEDGRTRSGENFYDLLQAIDRINDGVRVRISSIEPNLLTNDIIDLVASSSKLMPHFHVPLQQGTDKVLSDMHRKYNVEQYRSRIQYIRSQIPHAAIGVDVIVGFPTETDQLFAQSLQFVKGLDVSYLHVFTYSERDNTRAIKYDQSVDKAVRRDRNKQYRILSDQLKRRFYHQHLGEVRQVLFEHENDNGYINGYTDNYIRVRIPYNTDLVGQVVPVLLTEVSPHLYMNAELCLSEI